MKVTVTTNADAEARKLDTMARDFDRLAAAEILATARDALPAIQQGTPVDTGELQSSWEVRGTRRGATATNTARHAEYVGDLVEVADAAFTDALAKRPEFTPDPEGSP